MTIEGAAPQAVPPRTHMLLLVDAGEQLWLADAGFGAAYLPPLLLREGASATSPDGARHRLRRLRPRGGIAGEWVIERAGAASATDGRALDHEGWQAQYSFDLTEVAPNDLEMSNHWTSSRAESRFTQLHLASIVLPQGFASLNGTRMTMHHQGRADTMELRDPEDYRAALADLFRIVLSGDEVMALGVF